MNMTDEERAYCIEQLGRMKALERVNTQWGICANFPLDRRFDGADLVGQYAPSWQHYSGHVGFPLPGGAHAYLAHRVANTLWEGEQLRLRLSLIDHIIACLTQETEECRT